MVRLFFFFLCLYSLNSCTRLREFPVEGHFDGIRTSVSQSADTNIFITHGIGGFTEGDPETFIKALAAQLGLRRSGPVCAREIINESGECSKSYGFLRKYDFIGYCQKNVHVYVLDWRNATRDAKLRLQLMDNKNAQDKLPLFNKIKNNLIDKDFSDFVLYLSDYRKEIEYPVMQSIRWIEEDAQNQNNENIIIGYSLGGLIAINALDNMLETEENQAIAKKYINDITGVFFLSNSYPMFQLSEIKAGKQYPFNDNEPCSEEICSSFYNFDSCWDWKQSALGRFVYAKRESIPTFQIIAFNDPNDLLSYQASDYFVPSGSGYLNVFLNENVRNAKIAILGLINPYTAHTGYGKNKKVLSLMINGDPRHGSIF